MRPENVTNNLQIAWLEKNQISYLFARFSKKNKHRIQLKQQFKVWIRTKYGIKTGRMMVGAIYDWSK